MRQGMSDEHSEIDRCDNCGGLLKRLRDFDQAVCRCDKPSRPGKRGRPPRPGGSALEQADEEKIALLEDENEARGAFKRPED